MLKGAIFDLDGVIVNTVPLHFKAWKKMFSGYGRGFTFREYKQKVDGIPRMDGAAAILTGLSLKELKEAALIKQKYYLEFLDKDGVEVYHSTVDLIKELRTKGIKTAAISSSRNCLHILQRVGVAGLFDVIIGGQDIKKGKPAPDVFFAAAKKIKLRPRDCLVFEDAVLGLKAARRAKMKCVAISRYKNPGELAKADLLVSDLGQVNIKQLEQLFAK